MKTYYEQTAAERTEWQTGDFIDESETQEIWLVDLNPTRGAEIRIVK